MDMDDLLTASVLDDIEARHWNWDRYKMTWPPEIAPADVLISRIVRELEKCTLSVQMVLKVRTQAHQQRDVRGHEWLRASRWYRQPWIVTPPHRSKTI